MKINTLFFVRKLFDIKKRIIFDEDIKKRVLIFSPEAGLDAHFSALCIVGKILEENNCDVWFAKCNSLFERCPVMSGSALDFDISKKTKNTVCKNCASEFEIHQTAHKFKYFDTSIYLPKFSDKVIERLMDDKNLLKLKYDGIDFSKLCGLEVCVGLKKTKVSLSDQKTKVALKLLMKSAIKSYLLVNSILKKHKFDVICYFNDYAIQLGASLAAEKNNVSRRLISHASHKNVDRRRLVIFKNSTAFEHYFIKHRWNHWKKLSLKSAAVCEIAEDLIFRLKGKGSHIYSKPKTFESPFQNKSENHKKTIALFTSSPDEFAGSFNSLKELGINPPPVKLLFGRNIDDVHVKWINEVARHFRKRKDINLIIRIHPREGQTHREKTASSHLEYLKKNLNHLPKNSKVIWPDSEDSSYDLAEQADLILTSWSTIGAELARLGAPVLACTEGISGAVSDSFHQFASNKRDYFGKIEMLLNQKCMITNLIKAYRWWNLFCLAPSVDISDIIPKSDFTKVPDTFRTTNANDVCQSVLSDKTIFQLNLEKLKDEQSSIIKKEEVREIKKQSKRIIHFLLTGEDLKSPPEFKYKKIKNVNCQTKAELDTWTINDCHKTIYANFNDKKIIRYSPLISRLASMVCSKKM